MPLRLPKMNFFIFGFHLFVWCPKWTPASSSSFIENEARKHLPFPPDSAGAATTLPLAELEPGPRPALAVLLAFLHPGVPRQKALFLQLAPELRVELGQGARDPVADGAGLAGGPSARHPYEDVELLGRVHGQERLLDDHLQDVVREVLVERALVDGDGAGARDQPDARHRGFPATRGRVLDCDRQFAAVVRGPAVRRMGASGRGFCASCGCAEPL